MPASYSDILLGKLALQYQIVSAAQLHECLNALEAGQRAGVAQTLTQVLVKRGYLTRAAQRDLDVAVAQAERGRRAKLIVQLLLKHGRPGENVLRAYYESLKSQGFPLDLAQALEQYNQISKEERAGLEAAVERAIPTLIQREAEALAQDVEALRRQSPAGGSGEPPPLSAGAAAAAYRATGMRQVYVDPAQSGMVPMPGAVFPGMVAPVAPGAPIPPPPVRATGVRAAFVMGPDGSPVPVAVAVAPGASLAPMPAAMAVPAPGHAPWPVAPGMAYPGAYPAAPPGHPCGMTAQRPAWQGGTRELHAYGAALGEAPPGTAAPPPAFQAPALPPGAAPAPPPGPGAPPAHFGRTVERAAVDMKNLPAWAKTGFRKIDPDALKVPAEPEKKPKKDGLQEPSGPVPGFEMQEKISKGKTGVVYRALEKETGRIVALKVMYPIFMKNAHLVERFKREAKIASRIDHPNILKVYSGGEAGGHLYVSMELVEGETLHEKIEKQTVLPEPDALRWIAQIARAMDHYGRQGIVHRDVKPEHVLITKDNRALLCELGMSKKAYEEFAQTAQGSSFGAPYYVSPEQGMGVLELDIRSDIYSLGVTLFHCLTGRVPFLGGNAGVIISKHATEAIPDVRKLNPKVTKGAAALIERMMAKKREDRHQTPKELLAEIAWLRSESGVSSTPIVPLDPPGSDDQKPAAPPKPPARKPGIFQRMLRAVGFAR